MRKLIFPLLCVLASTASAQTSYTFATDTSQQDNRIERGRLIANEQTCLLRGRAVSCTQADACVPLPLGRPTCPGGASCTAAQARACGARIYPNSQAGREEFIKFELVAQGLKDSNIRGDELDRNAYCNNWWPTATNAEKHADCVKSQRGATSTATNPCNLCQN